MGRHVVIGAGGIGRATARSLLEAGQQVVVLSRSGPKDLPDGAEGRAVDITDAAALEAAVAGADSIVNAVNPSRYWRWAQEWPVMAASILGAAERSGAGLVTISNLYGYGRVDAPMTEDTAAASERHQGRDQGADVARRAAGARCGTLPRDGGAPVGLLRSRCARGHEPAQHLRDRAGGGGEAGEHADRRPRRAALVELPRRHRRPGCSAGHRRRLGSRLARADAAATHRSPGRHGDERAAPASRRRGSPPSRGWWSVSAAGSHRCCASSGRPATSSSARSCWTPPLRRRGSGSHPPRGRPSWPRRSAGSATRS